MAESAGDRMIYRRAAETAPTQLERQEEEAARFAEVNGGEVVRSVTAGDLERLVNG